MKNIFITIIFTFCVLIVFGNTPVVKSLSKNVLVITPPKRQLHTLGWPNDIINSVAIKTEDGIILIDTQNSPANARTIKQVAIERFQDDRFVYVINTHGHSCHSGGNCVFDSSKIVAHINSLKDIKNYDDVFLGQTVEFLRKKIYYKTNILDTITVEGELSDSLKQAIDLYKSYKDDLMSNYSVRYPDVTFDDKLILSAGTIKIELVYMGKGHSDGDVSVYVPSEQLLCIGNLFHLGTSKNEGMPNFYINRTNEIAKWITSMDYLLNDDHSFDEIVTTHGKKPLQRTNLEFVNEYCKQLSVLVSSAKQKGQTLEDVQDIDLMKEVFNKFRSVVSINTQVEDIHARNAAILWKQ